jgi:hypothetical protein
MVTLQAIAWMVEDLGPASRVVFRPYLPFPTASLAILIAAAVTGASLGAEVALLPRLRGSALRYSVARVACGCVLGSWLAAVPAEIASTWTRGDKLGFDALAMATFLAISGLGGWAGGVLVFKAKDAPGNPRAPWVRLAVLAILSAVIVGTQLGAFPSNGTAAEREAWARANVRQYPGLARIVSGIPEVVSDVGRVATVAPTARDQHSYAREMNGDGMRFTLDVIGERGAGIFVADGTIDEDRITDWRSGVWSFGGRTTEIDPRRSGEHAAQ